MAQEVGTDEMELAELGRSLTSLRRLSSSFSGSSEISNGREDNIDEETALRWAAIDRLPIIRRARTSLFDEFDGNKANGKKKRVIDVTELGALERHVFVKKFIKNIEHDNLQLLQKIRKRIDK